MKTDLGVFLSDLRTLAVVPSLLRYDNRCRHLRAKQVQEKLAQGVPRVIRFRLETGVEPFQDLIFGWNHHEVAQVRSVVMSLRLSVGFPQDGITHHFRSEDCQFSISQQARGCFYA